MPLPPPDLIAAIVVMTSTAIGLGITLIYVLKRRTVHLANVGAFIAVVLLVLHAVWLNGNPVLARLVRSPDAIVWANFSPVFVAILIASAWRTMAIRWQRWFMAIVLAAICLMQAYGPIFGRVPATGPSRVVDGVHRQSTLSTCSAAAAATMLGTVGIPATEAEMADLCLTREGGTLQLGLYRGLRLKAPNATIECLNGDFGAVVNSDRAVIVSLGEGESHWNFWRPRVGHSVVILGHADGGRLLIGDPMTGGRYPMTRDAFRRVWDGEALRVVPRINGREVAS